MPQFRYQQSEFSVCASPGECNGPVAYGLELWTGLNFSARSGFQPGPLNKLEFWARPVRISGRPGRAGPVAPCSLKSLFITSKIRD